MSALKRKLDLIAKHINECDAMLKEMHGPKAYLYFEAEGRVFAMRGEDGYGMRHEPANNRQERIIESSKGCSFDCGAW
jgi:hypothetical protein